MTLQDFKDILLTVLDNVYHFEAYKESEEEYIVWQETSESGIFGSNRQIGAVKKVQVDLYSRKEFTGTFDKLKAVLNENEISFEVADIDYSRETKRTRYIIECEVI